MNSPVSVTYLPEWRRPIWDADIPSREAWFVTCTEHDWVGKSSDGDPWGYAHSSTAHSVATKHLRAYRHDP